MTISRDNIRNLNFEDSKHEGLMTVWWTGVLLKKEASRLFKDHLSSEAQFNVLMAIKYADGKLTQKDLSDKLLVDKSNVTGLIDRLEKSGFLCRKKVPEDRRSYHVELTTVGARLVDELDERYMDRVGEIMSEFSHAEVNELMRLMGKIKRGLGYAEEE